MDNDWRSRARCRGTDPDLFFPDGRTGTHLLQIEMAKAVCRSCEVRSECLREAIEVNEEHGIRGGFLPEERKLVKRGRILITA